MKNCILVFILALGFSVTAQELKPTFEKEGDKVKATYFHANGTISQQGFFLNEKLEGAWNMFDEQGEKIAMGNYEDGVKIGKWLFYEGASIKEVNFDNNRIAGINTIQNTESVVTTK